MPRMTVVIGGNGAGKTSWAADKENRSKLPGTFYNADTLARGLGDWNDPEKQKKAREIVDKDIDEKLKNGDDFGFESTYSGSSRPAMVRRAKEAGYTVEAIFVGTDDAEINVDRVAARSTAGTGHSVPISEIRRRWQAAQDNLVETCRCMDSIKIIDNSTDSWNPRTSPALEIVDGRITGESSSLSPWIDKLKARMNPEPQHVRRPNRHEPGRSQDGCGSADSRPLCSAPDSTLSTAECR